MLRNFLNTSLFSTLFVGITAHVMLLTPAANAQEDKLLSLARDSAVIAGGARFCKYDPDEIEDFTAKAEARLSSFAKDEYEKILARLEFKNILDAFTVKEPQGGCRNFRATFERYLRSVQ